jgi:periplasmic protein TonB
VQAISRRLTALSSSVVVHGVAITAVVVLLGSFDTHDTAARVAVRPESRMVWIPDPRPAARGGGRSSAPKPVQSEQPRTAALIPSLAPIVEPPAIAPAPDPPIVADPAPTPSVARADVDGTSSRDGDGDRPGLGPGSQGGPGGGGNEPYGVGNGVSAPIPLRRPPPSYTADAMRVRLQGVVVIDCVVQPNGTCSDIRVTRSLDTRYGLDQQAIASAREWRFRPGLKAGEPVPVRVTLEIEFTIR